MKDFNKENEDLTDQELMQLIESDKTLSSFIKPEFVMGQVYERFKKLASAPEPGINLNEAWISVEDRLPEGEDEIDRHWLICFDNKPSRYPCRYDPNGKMWIIMDTNVIMKNVTHWCDFPTPPTNQ